MANLARLRAALNNSGIQSRDNALYQVITEMLNILIEVIGEEGELTAEDLPQIPKNKLPATIAYEDEANIFNQDQTIVKTRPALILQTTGDIPKVRVFSDLPGGRLDLTSNLSYNGSAWNRDDTSRQSGLILLDNAIFYIFSVPAGANPATLTSNLTLNAAGDLTIRGAGSYGGSLTAGGQVSAPSANFSGQVNTGAVVAGGGIYTKTGSYFYPGRADIAPDGNIQGSWYLGSHPSYGLISNTGLYCSGSIYAAGGFLWTSGAIYERSRAAPLGEWTAFTPTFSAGVTLSLNYGTWYMLYGKTAVISAYWALQLSSAITSFSMTLPAGLVSGTQVGNVCLYSTNTPGTGGTGLAQFPNGGSTINFYRTVLGDGTWPAGGNYVAGVFTFPIQ